MQKKVKNRDVARNPWLEEFLRRDGPPPTRTARLELSCPGPHGFIVCSGAMASLELSRDSVRKQIMKSLPSDADLEAFISDFFPEVYQRFSAGMQRTQKVTLLLDSEPELIRIVEKLHERCGVEAAAAEGARCRAKQSALRKILLGVTVALLTATAAVLLQQAKGRPPATSSEPVKSVEMPSTMRAAPPPVAAPQPPLNFGPNSNNIVGSPGATISTQIWGGSLRYKPPVKKKSPATTPAQP